MLQTFCEFSPDYQSKLRLLKDPLNLHLFERVIQFPFAQPVAEEKTEEDLARIAEKRKEQGRKLQEIAARSRQEKVFLFSCRGHFRTVHRNADWLTSLITAGTERKRFAVHVEPESAEGV